jgi:hypothetical protein
MGTVVVVVVVLVEVVVGVPPSWVTVVPTGVEPG